MPVRRGDRSRGASAEDELIEHQTWAGSSSGREVKASVPVSSHDLLTVVTYLSSVRMREGM